MVFSILTQHCLKTIIPILNLVSIPSMYELQMKLNCISHRMENLEMIIPLAEGET